MYLLADVASETVTMITVLIASEVTIGTVFGLARLAGGTGKLLDSGFIPLAK